MLDLDLEQDICNHQ